jgi:hypothetical protein
MRVQDSRQKSERAILPLGPTPQAPPYHDFTQSASEIMQTSRHGPHNTPGPKNYSVATACCLPMH